MLLLRTRLVIAGPLSTRAYRENLGAKPLLKENDPQELAISESTMWSIVVDCLGTGPGKEKKGSYLGMQ